MESLQVKIRQTGAYKLTVLVVLACLCVASTLVCVAIGSVHYTVGQVMDVFRFQPGAPSLSEIFSDPEAEAWLLVWNVRLPRIICGGLVGICLSLRRIL